MTNKSSSSPRLYTLYFIRHAEAAHNVLEKQAQSDATALAIEQGHHIDSAHVKQAKEVARKKILENDSVTDPPLSESGLKEARHAKKSLETLIATYDLPAIEEVWVSPLQRTLQTAATIFPNSQCPQVSKDTNGKTNVKSTSSNGKSITSFISSKLTSSNKKGPRIRVKKEIEERQTGLACDTHSSYDDIDSRDTFKHFSMSSFKTSLLEEMEKDEEISQLKKKMVSSQLPDTLWEDEELSFPTTKSSGNGNSAVEDKPMLRKRTHMIFDLLKETNSSTICLIGHKGYLRELERGPLGNSEAELFKNCEVRVYRLEAIEGDNTRESRDKGSLILQSAERIASSAVAT